MMYDLDLGEIVLAITFTGMVLYVLWGSKRTS